MHRHAMASTAANFTVADRALAHALSDIRLSAAAMLVMNQQTNCWVATLGSRSKCCQICHQLDQMEQLVAS